MTIRMMVNTPSVSQFGHSPPTTPLPNGHYTGCGCARLRVGGTMSTDVVGQRVELHSPHRLGLAAGWLVIAAVSVLLHFTVVPANPWHWPGSSPP